MEATMLSRKGQVRIAAKLRERLGLKIGASIVWSEHDGVLAGVPLPERPVEELFGAWPQHEEAPSLDALAQVRAEERAPDR